MKCSYCDNAATVDIGETSQDEVWVCDYHFEDATNYQTCEWHTERTGHCFEEGTEVAAGNGLYCAKHAEYTDVLNDIKENMGIELDDSEYTTEDSE